MFLFRAVVCAPQPTSRGLSLACSLSQTHRCSLNSLLRMPLLAFTRMQRMRRGLSCLVSKVSEKCYGGKGWLAGWGIYLQMLVIYLRVAVKRVGQAIDRECKRVCHYSFVFLSACLHSRLPTYCWHRRHVADAAAQLQAHARGLLQRRQRQQSRRTGAAVARHRTRLRGEPRCSATTVC